MVDRSELYPGAVVTVRGTVNSVDLMWVHGPDLSPAPAEERAP